MINQLLHWQSFAFIGIVLEINGFILMTFIWGNHPTAETWGNWRKARKSYYDKWYTNHMKSFQKKMPWYRKSWYSHMYVDNVIEDDIGKKSLQVKYMQLPWKFRWYWNWRTKIPSILPVIVGLGLQGYQIFFFYLIKYFLLMVLLLYYPLNTISRKFQFYFHNLP